MLYKNFIDDSGSKEYIEPYDSDLIDNPLDFKDNEEYWRNNYFVLTAVRIKQDDLGKIDEAFRDLKKDCFSTDKVEIKSVWLRHPDKRVNHYLEPFSITDEELNNFGHNYFDKIAELKNEIKIISAVVDKRYFKHRDKISNAPLLRATQVILERVHDSGGLNTLVFDQMDRSTSKWKGNNGKILGVYLSNEHMEKVYTEKYTNIVDCVFGDSSKDNLLQIADVCSYCVYRQFVMYGPNWSKQRNNETLEVYPYFAHLSDNFYRSPYMHLNRVVSYGLTVIPNPNKLNWQFLSEKTKEND